MVSKFLFSKSSWVYSDLSKIAASFGGPKKFINAVLKVGQVQGIKKVLSIEAGGVL